MHIKVKKGLYMKKQYIKTIICVVTLISMLFSIYILTNEYHLVTCHEEHCSTCSILHLAKIFNDICKFFIYIISIYLVFKNLTNCINKLNIMNNYNSLIKQNIQLNE